jgi:hypothetical protein
MTEKHNRTYRLDIEITEQINAIAAAHNVGVSDLVNYLLHDVVKRVERGELGIEARHTGLKRIVYEHRQNGRIEQ